MSERSRNALVGLVAVGLLVALGWGVFLFLAGVFKPGFEITATFERAGQLLRGGSDVKARGVLVGEVREITVTERGNARVVMRIFPEAQEQLPENVSAAIRAKTLFGEKLVELQIPSDPSERRLSPGDEIPLERTIAPFEVETILRKTVPLLAAIDPAKLADAIEALARGVVGNEQALRDATDQGAKLLDETAGTLPEFERNLVHLRNFGETLDDVDSDLLEALDSLEIASAAIGRRAGELEVVLDSLPRLTGDLGDVFQARRGDLADLAAEGADVLRALQAKAPDLPAVVRLLDGFLGVWLADLSAGPYWRILVTEAPTLAAQPYPPGGGPAPRGRSAERAALLGRIPRAPADGSSSLTELLFAPVPTEALPPVIDRLGVGIGVAP